VSQAIEQEIRTLRTHFWSARDPEGRAFAPLADAYRRKGDLEEAVSLVEDGLARLPEFSPGHLVAARIFRARGDLEAARESLDHLLELDPENVLALLERSELARDTGDREGAMQGLRRLLDLDPDHLGARAALDRLEAAAPAPEISPEARPAEVSEPDPAREWVEPEEETAAYLELEDTSLDDLDPGTWGLTGEEDLQEDELHPEELEGFEATGLAEETAESAESAPRDTGDDLAVFDFGMDMAGDEEPDPAVERPPLDSQGVDPVLNVDDLHEIPAAEESQGAEEEVAYAPDVTADDPADPPVLSTGVEDLPPHLVTRTMAELYLAQGLTEDGIRIYEKLVEKHPGDDGLRNRLEELRRESGAAVPAPEDAAPSVEEQSADPVRGATPDAGTEATPSPEATPALERPPADDLDERAPQWSGEEAGEAEPAATPFAWTSGAEAEEEEVVDADAGRSIRHHFDDLLAWVPGAVPIGDLSPEAPEERAPAGSPLARSLESSRDDAPPRDDVPAAPAEGEAPDAPPEEQGDDDLDDFRSWLESLGS